MSLDMALKVVIGVEAFAADFAWEPSLSLMYFEVLIEVRFLRKSLITTGNRAHERSFSGVYSEMIEEVVPFAKFLIAVWESASEQSHKPLRFLILEL